MRELIKNIREVLQLDQNDFANATGRQQGSISNMETGRSAIAEKFIKRLEVVFFINPEYFKQEDAEMFLPEKRNEALSIAKNHKSNRINVRQKEEEKCSDEFLAFKVEQLTKEITTKDVVIESKNDMIFLLKSQMKEMENQYKNIMKEIGELKDQIAEGKIDPNGKSFQQRSG